MNKPYDLVITVLDTATVFEAAEDAFRYDLTSAGIKEGWALDKIVEQAKQLLPQWPAATIQIIAETTVKGILAEQLLEHGVSVEAASTREVSYTKREPTQSDHVEYTREPQPDAEAHDARRKTVRAKTLSFSRIALAEKLHPLHGLLVVLVITVAVVSWWAMGKGLKNPSPESPVQSIEDRELSSTQSSYTETKPVPTASVTSSSNNDVVLHHARIQVLLPSDYHLAEKEGTSGMVVATGDDPELRIFLSIDPVGSTAVEAIYAELDAMITHDPTLTHGQTLGITKPTRLVSYEERPGDGSYAHWWSWVDQEHVYSVGCHSKQMSTIPQRAVCRKAVESVSVRSS
ncbi:type VII secretion-associated protein [Corynebacterium ulcerans]|uniref:type VII secretion-associated protein n=1 Tax=Corynebacterium ulcerans TaxID=65058 RepID=UPI0005FEB13A|nr:type VII secretion-associated protein [Corynebacterium ulcerans]AKA96001.1 Hypothetical protein CUL131002_0453 [Corynebacterium ulcerans]